jgi:hypothetical protein
MELDMMIIQKEYGKNPTDQKELVKSQAEFLWAQGS